LSELGKWAAYKHEFEKLAWSDLAKLAAECGDFQDMGELDWHKIRNHGRSYIRGHADEFPEKPGFRYTQEGNTANITYTGPNFTDLDDLLDFLDIDTEVWNPYHWTAHPYQGFSKDEEKDLTFDEGKISGTVKAGGHLVSTLWSITVKMVRRKPDPIFPTFHPIKVDFKYDFPKPPKPGRLNNAVIITDLQAGFYKDVRNAKLDPFHDRKLLDIALQICIERQPDTIILAGDIFDSPNFSDKFIRKPEFAGCMRPAILEIHWYIRQLREGCPKSRIIMLEGNHDKRINDAILKHLPAAYGLKGALAEMMEFPPSMSVPGLLDLDSLGVEWIGDYPDSVYYLRPDMKVEHGHSIKPQPDNGITFVGHTHRQGRKGNTRWTQDGPRTDVVIEVGCACRLDKVPGRTKRQNWHQGLEYIEYEPDGVLYADTPISVIDGRGVFDGVVYQGRDRIEDLRKAFPEWNW